jgi:hypothetical protein
MKNVSNVRADSVEAKKRMTQILNDVAPRPFRLTSVERTDVPHGGEDQQWFSYTLDNGRSQVRGKQSGSLQTVTAYATQCAEDINARVLSGHSVWSPRSKRPIIKT